MAKENSEDKQYPVKSLHDFLSELDKEYTKFRNGTLIGLISSGILFFASRGFDSSNKALWIGVV